MEFLQQAAAWLGLAGTGWLEAKTAFERSISFNDDAIHVIAGVLIQLAVAALLRRSLAAWGPWLAVLSLELLNEGNDLVSEIWPGPDRAAQWGEGAKDIVLTLFLPTLLMLLARRVPLLLSGRR